MPKHMRIIIIIIIMIIIIKTMLSAKHSISSGSRSNISSSLFYNTKIVKGSPVVGFARTCNITN